MAKAQGDILALVEKATGLPNVIIIAFGNRPDDPAAAVPLRVLAAGTDATQMAFQLGAVVNATRTAE